MKNGLATQVVVPIAVVVIGVLIAAYMIGSRPEARPNPPSQIARAVTIVTARPVTVRPEIRVFGEIASGREAEIRSMVAGRLIYLGPSFRTGAYVEAGSQLAAIDPFEYDIVLREQQADLAEAQARSRELQSDLGAERQLLKLLDEQIQLRLRDRDRIANLARKNQSSEKALDDAKLALNLARQLRLQGGQTVASLIARLEQQSAVVARNQAQVERANRDLADTKLSAPFSGFLQDIDVANGKRVAVGESIGRLIEANGLEAHFELSNADYSRLVGSVPRNLGSGRNPLIGTDIEVAWQLGASRFTYTAMIERVAAEIDSSTGGVNLYARITGGPTEILRPGAFVEVFVPDLQYDNVIVLPATAVSQDDVIYIVADARLVAVQVTVVRKFSHQVFIRTDIAPDTAIIAEQFPDIGPGILVRPM